MYTLPQNSVGGYCGRFLDFENSVVKVYLEGLVVLEPEVGADLLEAAGLPPAGLRGAGAGYTVALAYPSHRLPHGNPTSLIVVDASNGPGVGVGLVQELLGDGGTVDHVVRAATPLPRGVRGIGPVALAAAGPGQAALRAVA